MTAPSGSTPLANAGVRFPPPIIFLLGLVAGYAANKLYPWWVYMPEPRWMFLGGFAVIALGLACALSGIATFKRHQTAIIPFHPASTIVTSGPYRFTRNPMYVGMALVQLGGALLIDSYWALIAVPIVVAIIDRAVIAREERYLASAFGDAYLNYTKRVRRWL